MPVAVTRRQERQVVTSGKKQAENNPNRVIGDGDIDRVLPRLHRRVGLQRVKLSAARKAAEDAAARVTSSREEHRLHWRGACLTGMVDGLDLVHRCLPYWREQATDALCRAIAELEDEIAERPLMSPGLEVRVQGRLRGLSEVLVLLRGFEVGQLDFIVPDQVERWRHRAAGCCDEARKPLGALCAGR